jgi:hypothetical protein|tara:strand:- start:203 stop:562 length:360 start_codon:yes stop_codon:yes gene_type:complete
MKLTNKVKADIAAIVIRKLIAREIDYLRARKKLAVVNSDERIEQAIAGNLNASTGRFRVSKPANKDARELWYSLRPLRRQTVNTIADVNICNEWDSIAALLMINKSKIAEFAKLALQNK